nr:zinc finger, CCHC-type, retrotransposon Gag domain protein [Tanacetum cinerariifolium]
MPPKKRTSRRSNGSNNNENAGVLDPATLNTVNQAVATVVTQHLPQALTEALQAYHNGRFQKQKPNSFSGEPTPIDAENWIVHLEKIFEVLECTENQQVRLAVYKLEGDARRWWKTLKDTEGEGFVKALAWRDFLEKPSESITVFMERLVRLAGIAGTKAGDAEEQARKFNGKVKGQIRTGATTMAKGNGKVNDQIRTGDTEMFRGSGKAKDYFRLGETTMDREIRTTECLRVKLTQSSHMAKDFTSKQNVNCNGGGNNQHAIDRVSAMTAHQAATSQSNISEILTLRGCKAYVSFDTGSTHSVISSSFA